MIISNSFRVILYYILQNGRKVKLKMKIFSEIYFWKIFWQLFAKAHQATQVMAIFSKNKKQLAANKVISSNPR